MNIGTICDCILDENSSRDDLRQSLNAFAAICSQASGIEPAPTFDAWAEDSLLDGGVAINPQAAAHCAMDYYRSVVFIRGAHAALAALGARFPDTRLEVLYAGCGPFATLLMPLLGLYSPERLKIHFLDIHQRSLDSVQLLLDEFGFDDLQATTIRGDACHYQHPGKLHLIIAETMQKALEQEPQFAVTANLAPQLLPAGVFLPQRIEVVLYLADLEAEKQLIARLGTCNMNTLEIEGQRHLLGIVCDLPYGVANQQMGSAKYNAQANKLELSPTVIEIPERADTAARDAVLFTRITVFEQFQLQDYESEITLPLRCPELARCSGGDRYRVSYQLGGYPKFHFVLL